jgi:hypothetical protein
MKKYQIVQIKKRVEQVADKELKLDNGSKKKCLKETAAAERDEESQTGAEQVTVNYEKQGKYIDEIIAEGDAEEPQDDGAEQVKVEDEFKNEEQQIEKIVAECYEAQLKDERAKQIRSQEDDDDGDSTKEILNVRAIAQVGKEIHFGAEQVKIEEEVAEKYVFRCIAEDSEDQKRKMK